MKKKIGEIYNKPIVTGDKNLVTKNEIHESSLGDNSNNNEVIKPYYIKSIYEESSMQLGMILHQLAQVFPILAGETLWFRFDSTIFYKHKQIGLNILEENYVLRYAVIYPCKINFKYNDVNVIIDTTSLEGIWNSFLNLLSYMEGAELDNEQLTYFQNSLLKETVYISEEEFNKASNKWGTI